MKRISPLLLLLMVVPIFAAPTPFHVQGYGRNDIEGFFPSVYSAIEALQANSDCYGDYVEQYSVQMQLPEFSVNEIGFDCSQPGDRVDGSSFTLTVYRCADPTAEFVSDDVTNGIYCQGGDYELTQEDIGTLVGYLLGAFGFGFALGYTQRAFYRVMEKL